VVASTGEPPLRSDRADCVFALDQTPSPAVVRFQPFLAHRSARSVAANLNFFGNQPIGGPHPRAREATGRWTRCRPKTAHPTQRRSEGPEFCVNFQPFEGFAADFFL